MGASLATLGFEWIYPVKKQQKALTVDSIMHSPEEISDEQLVANIMGYATKNLYRNTIYRCDLYRGLDERVPLLYEDEDEADVGCKESMWRINIDHPIVYVLVAEKGQQPIHIIRDMQYGSLVIYNSTLVDEAIDHLVRLCETIGGYTILNNPEEKESDK